MRLGQQIYDVSEAGWQGTVKALTIPMEKRDIKLMGEKKSLDRYQAVVRTDNQAVMSIVSTGYRLVRHDEALAGLLEGLSKEGWQPRRLHLERGGAHALVEVINPTIDIGIKQLVPDSLLPRMILHNSVDLRGSLKANFGIFRLICTNGLMVPLSHNSQLNFRAVHVGATMERFGLFMAEVVKRLPILKELAQHYGGMMNTKVSPQRAETLLRKVAGKRQLERVMYLWEHAEGQPKDWKTSWGLYNGFTYWLTHEASGGLYHRDLKSQQLLRLLLPRQTVKP